MKPEFMRLRRALALAVTTLLAAAGLVVVAAPAAASAQQNIVGVSVDCVDAQWRITWTIENSEELEAETITASNHSELVAVGTVIDGAGIFIVSETTDVRITKTLTVTGQWADSGVTDSPRSATVYASAFDGDCVPTDEPAADEPGDDSDGGTGDAGDTGDSGDSGDSGSSDSGSGDTGDAGDTGDTAGQDDAGDDSNSTDDSYTPGNPDDESGAGISASATPCVYDGDARGSVNVSLTGLTIDHAYTVMLSGAAGEIDSIGFLAMTGSFSTAFTGLTPGSYTVTLRSAYSVVLGASTVTVDDCTPPVETPPSIVIQAAPCLTAPGGTAASVTVQLGGLIVGNSYRIDLLTGRAIVASNSVTATNTSITVTFPGLAAGLYTATVTTPAVSPLARAASLSASTDPIALEDCDELPTLAPPTIEASTASCDISDTAHRTIVVTLGELDETRNYFVTIVDANGALVPGGDEQPVSGVASASLAFTGIAAPGAYTAVLAIDPGRQVAAVTQSLLQLPSCSLPELPTLALTGPGDVVPLTALGGVLLLLGGALTMGGLRRRAAQ